MHKLIDSFDLYAKDIPGFNFEGRKKIGSLVGGFLSAIVFFLVLGISTIKFSHLMTNTNPRIANSLEHGVFLTNKTALELQSNNFSIAFQVNDFFSSETKDDPAMVRWFVEIVETAGHSINKTRKTVGTHLCTEADKAKFFEPARGSIHTVEKLLKEDKLVCLDSLDWYGKPLELYGPNDAVAHRCLDINYVPCEPQQITDENRHLENTECLVDLTDK